MLPTGVNGDDLQNVDDGSYFQMGRKKPRTEVGGVSESVVWCSADVVWPRPTVLTLNPGPVKLASGFWLEHELISAWEI